MKQENYAVFIVEKNEKKYQLMLPVGCKLGEAFDAAYDLLDQLTHMINDASKQACEKNEKLKESQKAEEPKEEK